MPITLNTVSGLLEANIVDENFESLQDFFKENIDASDFSGKISKYKISQHISGRITAFNTGSMSNATPEATGEAGTFENNWIAGTPAITYEHHKGKDLITLASSTGKIAPVNRKKNDLSYSHPMQHPFELLGYPGGSFYYDFQEQGFPDPVSYYANHGGQTVGNWPPGNSPLNRFPEGECWSRWLTIPDAAGSVYVHEPCTAIITAQVKGNYFFTPALRVHGTNASVDGGNQDRSVDGGTGTGMSGWLADALGLSDNPATLEMYRIFDNWKVENPTGNGPEAGQIGEGMQHSAFLRLGLFVDTNPIVWPDEFVNGDPSGEKHFVSGHGFNPWIGTDPDGLYRASLPDGVSRSRSWQKLTDVTMRVRQRGSYKVVGAVTLKGRRRYNFSLKFRPAMTFGWVGVPDPQHGAAEDLEFQNSYFELNVPQPRLPDMHRAWQHRNRYNPGWYWGDRSRALDPSTDQTPAESYFFPGGDALVTNMVESSSVSVEFFYGQETSSAPTGTVLGWDPTDTDID